MKIYHVLFDGVCINKESLNFTDALGLAQIYYDKYPEKHSCVEIIQAPWIANTAEEARKYIEENHFLNTLNAEAGRYLYKNSYMYHLLTRAQSLLAAFMED